MNARPILFSGPMVRAILAGAKTETRRVIRPVCFRPDAIAKAIDFRCPYGEPGGMLYVREAFAVYTGEPSWRMTDGVPARGRGVPSGDPVYRADFDDGAPCPVADKWRPSIHMPKYMSRIWLRLGDVRVERVQDIDEAGAVAEGVSCRSEFADLWEQINGPRGYGWDYNPWVWVLRRLERVPALQGALEV